MRGWRALVGVVAVTALGVATLGTGSGGAAGTESRASVYVSSTDDDTVRVIDPTTQAEIAEIAVGNEPRNLAPNNAGTFVYVPNRFSNDVSVIDTSTDTVVATVTDPGFDEPYAVAVTPDDAFVYVANKEGGGSSTGSVTVIDASTNTAVLTIDDACFVSPEGIAADPTRARVYVINRQDASVCIVDTSSNTVVGSFTLTSDGARSGIVTPDGAFLFVGGGDSGSVDKINLATSVVTPIPVTGAPRNITLSNDATKVYAPGMSDDLFIIDVATNAVSSIVFTGAATLYGVAVVPGTDFGYVTDADGDVVFVFDTSTDTEITGTGFPIPGTPNAMNGPRGIAAIGDPVPPPPPPPPPGPTPAPIVIEPTFTG